MRVIQTRILAPTLPWMSQMPDNTQYDPPIHPPISGRDGRIGVEEDFWTFGAVQDRLIEAYGFLRRSPDREAAWLRVSISSLYQQINPLAGLTAMELRQVRREREAEPPRMPGLTRDEVDRMEATLRWLAWIDAEDVRKIVYMAIADLWAGRSRVPWGELAVRDPRLPGSAERMRKAYSRAITTIANRLNSAFEPA